MEPENKPKLGPTLEVTPELKKLLGRLANGDSLRIVENGVVVGQLLRTTPVPGEADFFATAQLADRFMDRYRNAYKMLAK